MSHDLEPLDAEALAVLSQARGVADLADLPAGTRDRVWSSVAARVALGVASASPAGKPVVAPGAGGARAWVTRNPWLALSTALVVGVGLGAAARGPSRRGATADPVPSLQPSAPPAAVPVPPPVASPWAELPAPSSSGGLALSVSPPALPAPLAPSTGQSLAAESAILDLARASIAHGEPDRALEALDRHATSFPRGVLREEREALAIKALVLASRGDAARARAARFRERYPESLFLPAIESSLRSVR
jgi:hypothetical protein